MDGLVDTLRAAFVLLRAGGPPVMLARDQRDEDVDRIQLVLDEALVVKRCHWCRPGEWSTPGPFEGFSIDEVLATNWRIL